MRGDSDEVLQRIENSLQEKQKIGEQIGEDLQATEQEHEKIN
jgi:hypothetical protein